MLALGGALGVGFLAAGMTACAAPLEPGSDQHRHESEASVATPLFASASASAPQPATSLGREDETDVRVYEPPRLDVPNVSGFEDPRARWELETSEATYGACRGEGCCYVRFQKLFDPRKGKPIEIAILVCE